MKDFEHATATTVRAAVAALRDGWRSRIIAGGTDLLGLMKAGVARPERLVDVKPIRDLRYIRFDQAEGLRLGALATLDEVDSSEVVDRLFRAVRQAASLAATPQLRNVGTVAGNLCQESRCWYYRGPFPCWLKGGQTCYARGGDNRYHAILGGDGCVTVHPSDLATALMAMDARVKLLGPHGERGMPLDGFLTIPRARHRRLNALRPGELLLEVVVPVPPSGSSSLYLKAMDRGAWSFALVAVAAHVVWDGPIVRDIRVVLGGVAPVPWRVPAAEDEVRGRELTEDVAWRAGEVAVADALPLQHNRYKVALARSLVARALVKLAQERTAR